MKTRKIQRTGGTTYTVSLPKEWVAEQPIDRGSEVYLYPHTDGSIAIRATPKETRLSVVETRKVQCVGGSTYIVSLPKDWSERHDLEKGTRVHLHSHSDGSLIVQGSATQSEGNPIRIDVDDVDENALQQTVYASYTAGYETIRLVADSGFKPQQTRTITDAMRKLMGAEVIKETETDVVLKNLLDPAEVSIQQSVIQLKFVALSMYQSAVQAIHTTDTTRAEQICSRDDEADRLFGMVSRHFQRALTTIEEVDYLGLARSTLFAYYTTARQLERIADHAETLAVITLETQPEAGLSSTVPIGALAEHTTEIIEQSTDALLGSAGNTSVYEALERYDALLEELETTRHALSEAATADAATVLRILAILRGTADCGATIAETALQAAARDQTL